ncbi:cytochrome P450 2J2 isoform X2 [Desmodus rotundus]|uniref:cytochrome P450 2J2 isoform X2 n=1 Tax=Desmodus rotundus TaxID=9430 RepID=UPI00238110DE|nr:cytochrome P450 2J2-like isoform X2 [Desmodus rotundus]
MGSLVAAFWRALNPSTLLLGAVVFLVLANFFKRRRLPKNYPPGPRSVPFFGNFFLLDFKKPHLSLQKYVKKYGNVFSMEFGIWPTIVVTGLPLIKEALVHQGHKFLDRPVSPIRERIFRKNGLIMSNGQIWKEQRRFTLTTLRNFGLGKKSLDERIQEEVYHLALAMEEENGQPFNPHFKINNAISNVICSITFGERFEYQDDQFQEMLKLLDEVICLETSVWSHLYSTFPRIMHFVPGPHQALFSKWEKLKLFISHVIEKHKSEWNPDETRDFIDAYLKEMEKHVGNATSSFHEENLIFTTLDLFLAGTETTSTTLRWALLYMAFYPEIQDNVQTSQFEISSPLMCLLLPVQPQLHPRCIVVIESHVIFFALSLLRFCVITPALPSTRICFLNVLPGKPLALLEESAKHYLSFEVFQSHGND